MLATPEAAEDVTAPVCCACALHMTTSSDEIIFFLAPFEIHWVSTVYFFPQIFKCYNKTDCPFQLKFWDNLTAMKVTMVQTLYKISVTKKRKNWIFLSD